MDYEPHVKKYFEYLKYNGEKISEGDQETPDFFIWIIQDQFMHWRSHPT